MYTDNKKVELLAPAGSIEALKASVNAGCDAVYIGGSMFSARAYADNPDNDTMLEAIEYCHLRGKKLYLTVNTLFKNEELHTALKPFLMPLYQAGLDGVIVQDLGAMKFISEEFPQLPIHVSTQAAVTMAEGVNALRFMCDNITRVVPARELDLYEIAKLKKDSGLEVEVFVHGALCYSYSGQCLLSSFIGGRSGNRGRCAQPCRKKYKGQDTDYTYLLSCKDLCGLMHIGELISSGVDSFKIEGRMKSPQYCAGVVSIYRKYIDLYYSLGPVYSDYLLEHKDECETDIETLRELYNRGGFSSGYYHTYNGPSMMSMERPNHSGCPVGEVTNVRGREAVIRLSQRVNAHDVLELRNSSGRTVYEFSVKDEAQNGDYISAIVMKGTHAEKGCTVFRTKNNLLLEGLTEKYVNSESKQPVNIKFTAHKGKACELTIYTVLGRKEIGSVKEGAVVSEAMKAPMTPERIRAALLKLGDTPFCAEDAELDCDDDIFIPVGELNNLRREAVQELMDGIISLSHRVAPTQEPDNHAESSTGDISESTSNSGSESEILKGDPLISTLVYNDEQFGAVVTSTSVSRIYYTLSGFNREDLLEKLETKVKMASLLAKELYFALPYVCRDKTYAMLKNSKVIDTFKDRVGFLVRNKEELYLMHELEVPKFSLDYGMYVMNDVTCSVYDEEYTYPLELNAKELSSLSDRPGELIVYGYQPAVISTQCVYKNLYNKCRQGKDTDSTSYGLTQITDELNHRFTAIQYCDTCTNIILNSACLDLREVHTLLDNSKITYLRYDFTVETSEEIKEIIDNIRTDKQPYTYGHFQRGVE